MHVTQADKYGCLWIVMNDFLAWADNTAERFAGLLGRVAIDAPASQPSGIDSLFDAEIAAHRATVARGEIVRDGVSYDPERDFVTTSALRAMLRDQADVIRMLTAETAKLSQALDAQTKLNADLCQQVEALAAANKSNLSPLTTLQKNWVFRGICGGFKAG